MARTNMSSRSFLSIPWLSLLLFTSDSSTIRSSTRRIPHAEIPAVPKPGDSTHERLLPGAGCSVPPVPEIKAPKKNVWDQLYKPETHEVDQFLMRQPVLMLRNGTNLRLDIQLNWSNKTDVIKSWSGWTFSERLTCGRFFNTSTTMPKSQVDMRVSCSPTTPPIPPHMTIYSWARCRCPARPHTKH